MLNNDDRSTASKSPVLEDRKLQEIEFHNRTRLSMDDSHVRATRWTPELERTIATNPLWANMKYYSIERSSREFVESWLQRECRGKAVLDLCCGNGGDSLFLAEHCEARVTGIDLSDVSIRNCEDLAREAGLSEMVRFEVRDAERTGFPDSSFDIVNEYGSLHHVDLDVTYKEMARILRPGGRAICVETLGHNPIIHLYRRLTPDLRTPWEVDHILRKQDIMRAKKYFGGVEVHLFHLMTILAVPFRTTRGFGPLLTLFEGIDRILVRIPWLRWQAWQAVIVFSDPKKGP